MRLLISLLVCVVVSIICVKPLKRVPWLFYLLAILISIGAVYFTLSPSPSQLLRTVVFAVQKAHVAFGFFVVVMFIGVFKRDSRIRRYFNPVRAELSIIASLLALGHLAPYLNNYLSYASRLFSLRPTIVVSFLLAMVLLVLLIPLTITSFNVIKKRMNAGHWKFLQRFSYLFFGLIFFHLAGFLLIPALAGSSAAQLSLSIYATVFIVYAVLRIRRAVIDKKAEKKK